MCLEIIQNLIRFQQFPKFFFLQTVSSMTEHPLDLLSNRDSGDVFLMLRFKRPISPRCIFNLPYSNFITLNSRNLLIFSHFII